MADQGRGRARGRGAGRGQVPQQQPKQTTGRAVTRAQPSGAAGPGAAPPPGFRQQPPPAGPSGRAAHRVEPGVTQRMGQMSIQGTRDEGEAAGGNGSLVGGRAATLTRGTARGNRHLTLQPVRTRPESCVTKKGESGEKIRLSANYFRILTKPDYVLYQYRVDMAPEEDRTGVRRALLRVHQNVIGSNYIFDGTVLYTFQRLHPDPVLLYSQRDTDEARIQITLKFVAELLQGDYHYLQIYNIVIRKCLAQLNLQLLNRNYYDPAARKLIPKYNLELWPGYITSMRQHDGGVLLCTDIVHKVLRRDTAYDILENCIRRSPQDYRKNFQSEIVGQIVLTTYGNTKTYRVDDVDFEATPESSFDLKGTRTSYVEYFLKKYGVEIRNKKHQPMLVSMPKARDQRGGRDQPIYLVPELCQMTGITDEMRSNMLLMRAMAEHTRMNADARQQRLCDFNRRFYSVRAITDEMNKWQLKLDTQLVQFEGRVLPPEKLVLGNNLMYPIENADWTNSLRSNPLLQSGQLKHWVVLTTRNSVRDTESFVGFIIKAANGMNFQVESPRIEQLNDDRGSTIVDCLDRLLSRDKPNLVMCVVSNNRADRYSAFKKKTTVDRPVPSQVLTQKVITKKSALSIATKVAIQLSCKIGYGPWTVDMPLTGLMVVGYDVCHDSQHKGKSFGAMVASLNKPLCRYFSTVTAHPTGDEVFSDIGLNIGKAVMKYKQFNNNSLPSRIAIYRDGVGEGQLPIIMEQEVEHVKRALNEIYQGQPVKLAFIIVTKRINTRLFCGRDNPPAGTVVDDCVTHPEKYDFFLVSQSVRQGSVSPTGFNVVYDTIALQPDKLQRLSYKLTHLYYNWSGTVRVPAPCQYAHKLAFLVGQHLHRPPHTGLDDLLYFL